MDNINYDSLIKKLEKLKKQQYEANKRYYEKNKEIIKAKNLERYHNKKKSIEFPTIEN
jgi:hypothetical protein